MYVPKATSWGGAYGIAQSQHAVQLMDGQINGQTYRAPAGQGAVGLSEQHPACCWPAPRLSSSSQCAAHSVALASPRGRPPPSQHPLPSPSPLWEAECSPVRAHPGIIQLLEKRPHLLRGHSSRLGQCHLQNWSLSLLKLTRKELPLVLDISAEHLHFHCRKRTCSALSGCTVQSLNPSKFRQVVNHLSSQSWMTGFNSFHNLMHFNN